jgi:hypothetical protein
MSNYLSPSACQGAIFVHMLFMVWLILHFILHLGIWRFSIQVGSKKHLNIYILPINKFFIGHLFGVGLIILQLLYNLSGLIFFM